MAPEPPARVAGLDDVAVMDRAVEQCGGHFGMARRHEVSRGLVWNWRRQVRAGVLAPEPMLVFVPVQITTDAPSPGRLALPSSCSTPGKAVRLMEEGGSMT